VCCCPGGAETLLIEKNGCLGGAAADSLVMLFMSYYTRGAYGTVIKKWQTVFITPFRTKVVSLKIMRICWWLVAVFLLPIRLNPRSALCLSAAVSARGWALPQRFFCAIVAKIVGAVGNEHFVGLKIRAVKGVFVKICTADPVDYIICIIVTAYLPGIEVAVKIRIVPLGN
jgi:hypothetical protein